MATFLQWQQPQTPRPVSKGQLKAKDHDVQSNWCNHYTFDIYIYGYTNNVLCGGSVAKQLERRTCNSKGSEFKSHPDC